jgi:hypothetical protein
MAAVRSTLLVLGLLAAGFARAEDDKALTPNAHFMSGKLYLSQKVFDKAEHEFASAVEGDTTNAEYRTYWATALSEVAGHGSRKAPRRSATPRSAGPALKVINDRLAEASLQFDRAGAMDPKKQAAAAEGQSPALLGGHLQAGAGSHRRQALRRRARGLQPGQHARPEGSVRASSRLPTPIDRWARPARP